MFVNSTIVRECSGAFFIKDINSATLESFYRNILNNYKLVMLAGLPATGKSNFIQNYIPRPNHSYTSWNRENIMKMIINNNDRIEKFNKNIEMLEAQILKEMLTIDFHQVLIDGWYLIPYQRKRILSYKANGDSLCLVFDGHVEDIVNRALQINKLKLPTEEVSMFIKNKRDSATWPNFSEGWTDIIYMCSFDTEESLKYIKSSLRKVKDVI